MTDLLARVEIPGYWPAGRPDRHLGRALNAWFYRELAERAPELSDMMHALDETKPFTIAMVDSVEQKASLTSSESNAVAQLVITGYGPLAETVILIATGIAERLLLDASWWVRSGPARVTTARWHEVAATLLEPRAPTRARLTFLTPTSFHSRGRHYVPLPVANLVLGSLLARWQRWSPIGLGEDAENVIQECAILRHYRASSVRIQMSGFLPAFIGWAEFGLLHPPVEYAGLLGALTDFAPYAGVGYKVGMGLGCVHRVELPDRPTRRAFEPNQENEVGSD